MATKIKLILQKVLHAMSYLFSSWLSENGIDRKEQTFICAQWLDRKNCARLYKVAGKPLLYTQYFRPITLSLIKDSPWASTALDVRGYSHFVAMGKPLAYIFSSKNQRILHGLKRGMGYVCQVFLIVLFWRD